MCEKHTQKYYLQFWTEAREKLILAEKLDPPMEDKPDLYREPSRLIFGASIHNYRYDPMFERDIQSLEKKLDITFPINFRTYLAVCGINSGGPGYGITDQRISVNTSEQRKTHCPFEPRIGIGFTLDEGEDESVLGDHEYAFEFDDIRKGTIDIGTSGNPCSHHLVVNGKTQGDVFSFTGDMLFYESSFESWYMSWLDKILDELESGKAKEQFDKTFRPRTT